jgi:putative transposase
MSTRPARTAPQSRPLDALRPNTTSFGPGSTWCLDGQRVVVMRRCGSGTVLVQILGSGALQEVSVGLLAPERDEPVPSLATKPLADYSQAEWSSAVEAERLVRGLIDDGDCGSQARSKVACALGVSSRQMDRAMQRYKVLQNPLAFLPQKTGPKKGSSGVHPTIEKLMRQCIEDALKVSPDIAVDELWRLVRRDANALDLQPPGRATVARRLALLRSDIQLIEPHIAKELGLKRKPVAGAIPTEGPLDVVEVDHTVADVHLIEPRTGRPMGRPMLTIAIDRATRVILGVTLGLEHPSRLVVALCLHHAVMPKDAWLKSMQLDDACWPGYGLMRILYTDSAKEFRAGSHGRACEIYGLDPQLRPKGYPPAGAIVERAIGTLMTKVRLLPGASFSKLLGKKPKNAHRLARFTLAELYEYLARTVSIYHRQRHDGLGMPPARAWENAWQQRGEGAGPSVPTSGAQFLITFLPGQLRTVTREGIELFCLRYRSADLAPLVHPSRHRMVRYDPRDMRRVYVEVDGQHLEVPLAPVNMPAFSLWEWREIRGKQIEGSHDYEPEALDRELAENRKLIEKKARTGARLRDARRLARQDAWSDQHRAVTPAADASALRPTLEGPAGCRVME